MSPGPAASNGTTPSNGTAPGAPTSDATVAAATERDAGATSESPHRPAWRDAGSESHMLDRLRTDAGTPALADALALLRDAVREGTHVWLELVDGHGRPVRRRVRPLRVEAGRLRALDPQRGAELTVAVHRIAAVDPDDD